MRVWKQVNAVQLVRGLY